MAAKDDFFEAFYQGKVQDAERIWRDNGLSANVKDSATGLFGTHALGFAVRFKAHAFAEELIAHGAEVNARGEDGVTAMWMASDRAGVEILRRHGADANIPLTRGGDQFSKGAVALHRAAAAGDTELVAALLEAGANARAVDQDGVTPLHYGARGSEGVVRLLTRAGADLDAADKFGNTPRQVLEKTFPAFELAEVVRTEPAAQAALSAPAPQEAQVGGQPEPAKELRTEAGDYFLTLSENGSSRVGFLPSSGSLDGAIQFKSAAQLDEHLAGLAEKERAAVKSFIEQSEALAVRPEVGQAEALAVPSAPQVSEVVVNSIERAVKPDLRAELAGRLPKVDWYYAYSDDSSARMAGALQVQEALKDLETLARTDKAAAIELWEKHGVKHISAPQFLRDAQESGQSMEAGPVVGSEPDASQAKDDDARATPDEELENSISAAPGRKPQGPVVQQEDAFVRAPRSGLSTMSKDALTDGADQTATVSKEGPPTLLNGRFVRRDNGEYFRVADGQESKRVALVDEDEKIRFVDKQMDAFQAAIELAKHKEWEAILVTGTEKFRSEAWYHARMAGLEVVGYEPTKKDLATLAAAQSNGPAQTVNAAGVNLEEKAIADSKEAALKHALGAGAVVMETKEQNGRYAGKVIHQTEHHIVQDLGKKSAVLHEKSRFDPAELRKGIDRGESLRIQYDKGRAGIDAGQDRRKSQAISR
ncbi:KfrB domain-containing protein [Paraburkholderia fungorum]|uniref:KfrB domain-containing protein n=1 Tax=Paraburkholderia fungorum TaxID=134537 RepID=UPI00402B85B1